MKYLISLVLSIPLGAFLLTEPCWSQLPESSNKIVERAQLEYAAGKFAEAERDFGELVRSDPSNIYFNVYLGQALFRQGKYAESVRPYERVRELERTGSKLSSDQRRIVIDQLSMAYGISGELTKARTLLKTAIQQDPEYPINYYNLACVFAAIGEKDKMLANLSLAFQHKENVIKGEQMPNPQTDSSFQKFTQDDDFLRLMKNLGYK